MRKISNPANSVSYINVYNQCSPKTFSKLRIRASQNLETSTSFSNLKQIPANPSLSVNSPNIQSFKILHKPQTPTLNATKTLKSHKPIELNTPLNLQSLTSTSKKESIIFNQVKSITVKKPKKKTVIQANKSEKIILFKLKTPNYKLEKKNTMRRMLTEQESSTGNQFGLQRLTEKDFGKDEHIERLKRIPMKQRVWLWKGAGGEEVY